MGKGGVRSSAVRASAGVRSGWLLLAGAALSLLLHGAGALAVLAPGLRVQDKTSTVVELVSKQDDQSKQPRMKVRLARRDRDEPGAGTDRRKKPQKGQKPFRLKDDNDALKKPLHVAVDDELLAQTLLAVRKGIGPLWKQAEPPGMGKVQLRMEIDSTGSIVSMWITKLQGPPELGEFVASLVRRAAPFPDAGHGLSNPVVIDCAFNVTGGSGKADD